MSKVIVVKFLNNPGSKFSQKEYRSMLTVGLLALTEKNDITSAIRKIIPGGVIGLKTNCLAKKLNSTPVSLTEALCALLVEAGFNENDLIIWERTSRELAAAGYSLNASGRGYRCLGTDATGVGYDRTFHSLGEVNSLVSRILTEMVDYNINLPVLKDHSIAGLSAGLKNMYGVINNPNKYHENNCDPFCAEVSSLPSVKNKNCLSVIDAVRVQYQGGPGFVGKYVAGYKGIIISDDPVAADRVGLEILENLRKVNGQPPLETVGRKVNYLDTAQKIGLGVADIDKIDIKVINVSEQGKKSIGELF